MLTENKVQSMILEEAGTQNSMINENIKSNILLQKKEFDSLIRKLGSDIQEALTRIKMDIKDETNERLDNIEHKINPKMRDIVEEMGLLRAKQDKDFNTQKHLIGKSIEESNKDLSKKFGKLLDDTILAMEEQINDNIVTKVEKVDARIKELQHIDLKLDKHIEYVKDSFDKLTTTQDDHLELITELNTKIKELTNSMDPKVQELVDSNLDQFEKRVINEIKQ